MLPKSTIKYIQSLQQKKFRDEYGVFVAEGPKLVEELMADASFPCKGIYALEEWEPAFTNSHWPVECITAQELERISGFSTPNKVVAVFEQKPGDSFSVKDSLTLLLDDIRDPGNLGTIIRTADWFGIENMVCSPESADMYNPKVVQSTMASLGRVNVVYQDPVSWIRNNPDVSVLAATMHGKPLAEVSKPLSAVLVIGNESSGIRQEILDLANECISIPGQGRAESLNAAVAAGIILYQLTR